MKGGARLEIDNGNGSSALTCCLNQQLPVEGWPWDATARRAKMGRRITAFR